MRWIYRLIKFGILLRTWITRAPLIPGYIQHRKFTNRQSTWEFYSNIGFIKKKIDLMVTVQEWIEPTKVTFNLKGPNEKLSGKGYFLAEAINQGKTEDDRFS